jgi:hypothetical protein
VNDDLVLVPPTLLHEFGPGADADPETAVGLKDEGFTELVQEDNSNVVYVGYLVPYSSMVRTLCITELSFFPLKRRISPGSAVLLNSCSAR